MISNSKVQPGDDLLEIVGAYLDALGRADLCVVDICVLEGGGGTAKSRDRVVVINYVL